jgi:SAM-dependent methyltransferase
MRLLPEQGLALQNAPTMTNSYANTSARGSHRYQAFSRSVRGLTGAVPRGRLLDFGCGAGGFLQAALDAGLDAYGVEVAPKRQSQYVRIAAPERHSRFVLYDGDVLPFESGHFDMVYSWFVFEHVERPVVCIREIVRVAKPGALIQIHADDARNHWDGHVGVPVPAFMPRRYTKAYLDVFGMGDRADFINETVFYITAPTISSVLESLGCEVLHENTIDPRRAIPGGIDIASEDDARRVAREVKSRIDRGEVSPPTENLSVVARRLK